MTPSDRRGGNGSGPASGIWYFILTVATFGLMAWVPFAHAAARLRSRARAVQAGVYAGLATLSLVLLSIAPVDAQGNAVGAGTGEVGVGVLTLVGLVGVGCGQQVRLRREAYGSPIARQPRVIEPAVAVVLHNREKRQRAREIVATDPLMAHELRIGRPDLQRTFDDGGLIDLNAASARAIAKGCELTPDVARAIVDARDECGQFASVEDVFSLVDIPLPAWPIVRDRAVTITLAA